MNNPRTDYATLLHRRGLRMTPQREIVLDAICLSRGHTTFDEVVARVQARLPSMNRTTINRTLDFLQEQQLILAAAIGRQTIYEIAQQEPHHHLVCARCGTNEALPHAEVKPFFDQVKCGHQFTVQTNHLILVGLCRNCGAE